MSLLPLQSWPLTAVGHCASCILISQDPGWHFTFQVSFAIYLTTACLFVGTGSALLAVPYSLALGKIPTSDLHCQTARTFPSHQAIQLLTTPLTTSLKIPLRHLVNPPNELSSILLCLHLPCFQSFFITYSHSTSRQLCISWALHLSPFSAFSWSTWHLKAAFLSSRTNCRLRAQSFVIVQRVFQEPFAADPVLEYLGNHSSLNIPRVFAPPSFFRTST